MTSELFVTRWGSGPDVVFLHGLGASSRYWEQLAQAGDGYSGTAPDLLGFGRSPKPSEASYDIDCHLDALLPQLPDRAVVVAHSAGAILAAALAARDAARVSALLLLGLPAYTDEKTAHEAIGGLGLLARLTADERPAARWLCEAMCRFRPLALALAPLLVRDLPPSIASDGARHTWPSYSRTLHRVVIAHRVADDLRSISIPVRLLHGRDDSAAPLRFVEALKRQLAGGPGSVSMEVVAGDHHVAVRDPDMTNSVLQQMLHRRPTRKDESI